MTSILAKLFSLKLGGGFLVERGLNVARNKSPLANLRLVQLQNDRRHDFYSDKFHCNEMENKK
jgi:hypothetical protein